jgi:hypothetical protein
VSSNKWRWSRTRSRAVCLTQEVLEGLRLSKRRWRNPLPKYRPRLGRGMCLRVSKKLQRSKRRCSSQWVLKNLKWIRSTRSGASNRSPTCPSSNRTLARVHNTKPSTAKKSVLRTCFWACPAWTHLPTTATKSCTRSPYPKPRQNKSSWTWTTSRWSSRLRSFT